MDQIKSNKGSTAITIIIIIIILAIIAGGVYWFVIREDEFKDWETYRNKIIGIEFKYPNDWPELVEEYKMENTKEYKSSFELRLADFSHLDAYPRFNSSADEQYEQIKKECKYNDPDIKCKERIDSIGFEDMSLDEQIQCANINLECKEKISQNGVKYIWVISWNFRSGSYYFAELTTGKYVLTFGFDDEENYEKRADQYQKLLSTLKVLKSE